MERGGGGGKGCIVEWLLDFMFQLYVDGRMYEYVRLLLYWSASRAAASLLSERIKGGCFRGIVGARKSSILCILPLCQGSFHSPFDVEPDIRIIMV